ncbi:MAG: YigZ family protein [Lachnospirales bacterium]
MYKTVKNEGYYEFIEKKSRFIGRAIYVDSEDEAILYLNKIRKLEKGARHNCYAYRLKNNNITRFSDDGEPSGTGGTPILEIINKEDLYNVIVVVTRYFGGTLLGTGGLVRAYGSAGKEALINSNIAVKGICYIYKIQCEYSLSGKIEYLINQNEFKLLDTKYTDKVSYKVIVQKEKDNIFKDELSEYNLDIKKIEEEYMFID